VEEEVDEDTMVQIGEDIPTSFHIKAILLHTLLIIEVGDIGVGEVVGGEGGDITRMSLGVMIRLFVCGIARLGNVRRQHK
jgi:hypothetical protein